MLVLAGWGVHHHKVVYVDSSRVTDEHDRIKASVCTDCNCLAEVHDEICISKQISLVMSLIDQSID